MGRAWLGVATSLVCISMVACAGGGEGDDPAAGGGSSSGGASSGGSGGVGNGGSWAGGAAGSAGAGGASSGGVAGTSGGGTGNAGNTGGSGGSGNTGNAGGSGGSGNTGNTGGSGGGATNPICLGAQAGAYCGNDMMKGADPNTLYQCPGANKAPTSSTPCPNGCVVEAAGTPDHCKSTPTTGGYKLPWKAGGSMTLTQDCDDPCCNDHVGAHKYAWDWGNGSAFTVVASRGGTVTHLKINSTSGCANSSCASQANFIVIDHGDGTQSTYLHLGGMTLQAGVTCGASVQQGQALAKAGTTGWSTGVHLHFQVSKVHTGAPTCECGSTGTGCGAGSVPWANFWSSTTFPTLPIQFAEWPAASNCADRAPMAMPASQN